MAIVEIDREAAARAALDWFRRTSHKMFSYPDKDFLESEANLAIVKALDTYKPESGATLMTWCQSRIKWDVTSALRTTEGGSRSKLKGRKQIRLSAFEEPANIISFTEDKDAAIQVEDLVNIVKTNNPPRIADLIIKRSRGESLRSIGEEIGVSESRTSQINKQAIKRNRGTFKAIGEKKCSICERVKPRTKFNLDRNKRSGLRSECAACRVNRKYPPRLAYPFKLCRGCKEVKHVDKFNKQAGGRHGRNGRCAKCANEKQRLRRMRERRP